MIGIFNSLLALIVVLFLLIIVFVLVYIIIALPIEMAKQVRRIKDDKSRSIR